MSDSSFYLDSNIPIYAYSSDELEKRDIARSLLCGEAILSVQNLNEVANVLFKKFQLSSEDFQHGQIIEERLTIVNPFKSRKL